jgi:ribosomal protein S18 acetylase RimI-like enzyme
MLRDVHDDLVRAGVLEPIALGGAEEAAFVDCDLASLAENRLGERGSPFALEPDRRARWITLATTDRLLLPCERVLTRCYWLLHDGARAGTLSLSSSPEAGSHAYVASLYTMPWLRGRGIGRRALERVRDALGARGLGLSLDTCWSWQATVRFYVGIGMWLRSWKRGLTFVWDADTPSAEVAIEGARATLAVTVGGRSVELVRAERRGDALVMLDVEDHGALRLDARFGDAWSTLAVALALQGWPLVRSADDWRRSCWAEAGAPEGLAHKISIWEAWDRKQSWKVDTPRIPGLEYPTWTELQARWREESEGLGLPLAPR